SAASSYARPPATKRPPFGRPYSTHRTRRDLRLKLCTKSVDNAVENDLKNVPHRSLHYSQVILVKKTSKKNFPSAYQITTPSYDDAARGTTVNQSHGTREFQILEWGCAQPGRRDR